MSGYGTYCVHGGGLSLCVSVASTKEMSFGTNLRVCVTLRHHDGDICLTDTISSHLDFILGAFS